MTTTDRHSELARAFVQLAGALVGDFDVADLLQGLVERSVQLLDADAAGLVLSDHRGTLQVMASSTEGARRLELFQLQADEGPCVDCFRGGKQIAEPDLRAAVSAWPRFVPVAREVGFAAVQAFPLRLRGEVIGALNLFSNSPIAFSEDDQQVAQALADVATIAILSERALHDRELLVAQLEGALNSRIVIEQAKGVLAEAVGLDVDAAFAHLRRAARSSRRRLVEVATDLVDGRLDPSAVVAE
ncbi:ANTAR domain-containing protein [Antricoccus suffuscus]|uniref:ANTAR domain-containing protein n=1 Tax=Antricoccus suffuscus TaxID=1629062 RepID=A0A2T0Z8S3_9ACTN|nr:GAF and ANTAR domain-containing protein [Antricoccus suffuscus]PRZ32747.1 ANTAR domain-containing protein [Antricoccus suffuscus]